MLSGRIEVVRLLLKHGAESGVQNEEGKTALQIAAARGYNKIMDFAVGTCPARVRDGMIIL